MDEEFATEATKETSRTFSGIFFLSPFAVITSFRFFSTLLIVATVKLLHNSAFRYFQLDILLRNRSEQTERLRIAGARLKILQVVIPSIKPAS